MLLIIFKSMRHELKESGIFELSESSTRLRNRYQSLDFLARFCFELPESSHALNGIKGWKCSKFPLSFHADALLRRSRLNREARYFLLFQLHQQFRTRTLTNFRTDASVNAGNTPNTGHGRVPDREQRTFFPPGGHGHHRSRSRSPMRRY